MSEKKTQTCARCEGWGVVTPCDDSVLVFDAADDRDTVSADGVHIGVMLLNLQKTLVSAIVVLVAILAVLIAILLTHAA